MFTACRRISGALLLLGLFALPVHAQDAIGLGGGLWADSAVRRVDLDIGPLTTTTRDEVTNVYLGLVHLSFLAALGDTPLGGFRVGGDIRYLGFVATSPRDGDGSDGIGRAVEVGLRFEWGTVIARDLALSLGARVGLGALFPEDDFEDTLDRLIAEGVPTSGSPRFTVHAAPSVGLRWAIADWIHLRLDLGFGYTFTPLSDVTATVQGIPYARRETLHGSRFDAVVTAEIPLP